MALADWQGLALAAVFRAAFLARRARAQRSVEELPPRGSKRAKRNILFITVDQQRHDALGVSGGRIARTPRLDALARSGVRFTRAHVQNVVCMPSRATMLTGQHPYTHGVIANGVALPEDAPSIAAHLRAHAGYRTSLLGKAHFEPHLDPSLRFRENRLALEGSLGPWRGFEHVELATHGPVVGHHYTDWLWRTSPASIRHFGGVLTGARGGDTDAPEVKHNDVDRSLYHTDWVADRAIAWLRALEGDGPFFCWVSFPDPHHPFDPPRDEVKKRLDWRSLPLPDGFPSSREEARAVLEKKPAHWLAYYEGRYRNPEGGPTGILPAALTDNQLREIDAMIHVENELIDDAVGRILDALGDLGLETDTDVFYTSDHGELQGDFGLLFKGPYHVDALMRVPLLWRPAPSASVTASVVDDPVGLVDLAPTFCRIAGLDVPSFMEGAPLPVANGSGRERVLTTFDSQFENGGMHLRSIYRDGMLCTAYDRSDGRGGHFPFYWAVWNRGAWVPRYDGTEGELYDTREDPQERVNLWSDPKRRRLRDDLLDDLVKSLPQRRDPPLPFSAPT